MIGKARKDALNDAEDLLSGRTPLTARRLAETIHAVNPTGRALSPAETDRRYALKSRLQSLLIERFANEVGIDTDPENPGVVALRHRYLPIDACHAPLAALTEAARSAVQFRLDVGETDDMDVGTVAPTVRPRPRGSSREADDCLARGHAALEAYDYETARGCYTEALADPRTEAPAALALMELLVDYLGADTEAMHLGASLPATVVGHPSVRALRAIATARAGEPDGALALLQTLDHPRAVDAWVALARRRLQSQDVASAESAVAEIRQRLANHPALPELDRAVAALWVVASQPTLTAAQACVARGDLEGAETRAREVLVHWADSEGARSVLRAVRERRRVEAIDNHERGARTALGADNLDAAEASVRKLGELGGDITELRARITARREELRAATVAARSVELSAAIEKDVVAGLTRWLTADADVRAGVVSTEAARLLGWLSEALVHGTAPEPALVTAVLALATAEGRLAGGDAIGALELIEAHMVRLGGVPAARALARDARHRIESRRNALCADAIARSESLLADGDWAGARAALGDFVDAPTALHRDRVGALVRRLDAAEDIARRIAGIEALETEARWVEARDALDAMVRAHPEADGEAWRAWRIRIVDAIRAAWRIQVWEATEDDGDADDARWLVADLGVTDAIGWGQMDTGEVMHATTADRWLTVRVLDPVTARVRRRIAVWLPVPVRMAEYQPHGDVLWVIGRSGHVLAVDLATRDIVAWRSLSELIEVEYPLHGPAIVEGRFLWVFRPPGQTPPVTVIDLENWSIARHPPVGHWAVPVPGFGAAAVLSAENTARAATLRYLSARGEPGTGAQLHGDALANLALDHPDGQRAIVMDTAVQDPTTVRAYVVGPGCPPSPRTDILDDIDRLRVSDMTLDRAAGLLFFTAFDKSGRQWLAAVAIHGADLSVLWRVVTPAIFRFVYVLPTVSPIGILQGTAKPHFIRLGVAPPDFGTDADSRPHRLPKVHAEYYCHALDVDPTIVAKFINAGRGMPEPKLAQWLIAAGEAATADEIAELYLLSMRISVTAVWARLLEIASTRFSEAPGARLLLASIAGSQARWEEILTRLVPDDPPPMRPTWAAHWYHLRGVALFYLGQHDEALVALRAGAAIVGERCGQQAVVDLVKPLEDNADPSSMSLVTALRWAVQTADERLAVGDAAGARAAMACSAITICREVQSLARWSEAILRAPPVNTAEWFSTISVLGAFVSAQAPDLGRSKPFNLPLPDAVWDSPRIDELTARCRAWLDANPQPPFLGLEARTHVADGDAGAKDHAKG